MRMREHCLLRYLFLFHLKITKINVFYNFRRIQFQLMPFHSFTYDLVNPVIVT